MCPLYDDEIVCERDLSWSFDVLAVNGPPRVSMDHVTQREDAWSTGATQIIDGLGATLGLLLFLFLFAG